MQKKALENLRKEMYGHLLWTIFGLQILKDLDFLLCVIDIYRKYAWVIPLKDTK